jgi:hypothetical protein
MLQQKKIAKANRQPYRRSSSSTRDLLPFQIAVSNLFTMAASESLCGGVVSSRRGLLASLWFLVTVLTAVAFLLALIFTLSADSRSDNDDGYYNNDGEGNKDDEEGDAVMAVTSRAMAFAALWTAVLATLMGIFGTVILGWQSPTGQYYTCCSTSVHRTTPLALGSFIGALLMFANLTLVCSVLFGEFEVSATGSFRKMLLISEYSTTFQFPVHLTLCPF